MHIATNDFDRLPEFIHIVGKTAMNAEREEYLRAAPYQRTPEWQHRQGSG
jgi:putative transposase